MGHQRASRFPIEMGGHGERLLCAVFAFRDAQHRKLYFIYNYKRGFWYPFVPAGGPQERSTERELQLKAQMSGELPMESELERWFPLWGIPIPPPPPPPPPWPCCPPSSLPSPSPPSPPPPSPF